jgi:hypothetical protein
MKQESLRNLPGFSSPFTVSAKKEKYRISISFTASFKQKVKFIMKNGMYNVNNNK